jgi:hypothetical protein
MTESWATKKNGSLMRPIPAGILACSEFDQQLFEDSWIALAHPVQNT